MEAGSRLALSAREVAAFTDRLGRYILASLAASISAACVSSAQETQETPSY